MKIYQSNRYYKTFFGRMLHQLLKTQFIIIPLICSLLVSSCTEKMEGKSGVTYKTISPEKDVIDISSCIPFNMVQQKIDSEGSLILESQNLDSNQSLENKTILLGLDYQSRIQINSDYERIISLSVSPNGEKVFIIRYDMTDDKRTYEIDDNNFQIIKNVEIGPDWLFVQWLGNNQIIFKKLSEYENTSMENLDTFMVINTQDNTYKEVITGYPNIYDSFPPPEWEGWGISVYNEQLDKVVYLEDDSEGIYYTLWDVSKGQKITSLKVYDMVSVPKWMPDGKSFYLAANLETGANKFPIFEIYKVTSSGTQTQLTHLSDFFSRVYISDLSISPNGEFIAFWFSYWNEDKNIGSPNGVRNLGLFNLKTGQVNNFCVTGEREGYFGMNKYIAPMWSPDSKQIVFQSQTSENNFQIILLDIQSQKAIRLIDNYKPLGWLP